MLDGGINKGWRFDRFELRAEPQVLMRGDSVIPLTDVETKLLILLVQDGDVVIRRDDLVNALWSGREVTEHYIAMVVKRVRNKVAGSLIKTVYGAGYRLGCPVEPTNSVEEMQALYLTALFVRAEQQRQTMPDAEWDRLYLPKFEEIRAALDWSLAIWSRRHIGIALFGACARIFERLSLISEGRSYAVRLVDLIDDDIRHAPAAQLLRSAGILWREADRLRALGLLERSTARYRQVQDRLGLGDVLALLGGTHLYLGQHETALTMLDEATRILSAGTQTKALYNALNDLGAVHAATNMPAEAKRYYDQARELAQMLKDTLREHIVIMNLADLEFCHGAPDRAIIHAREAATGLRSAPTSYRVQPIANLSTYLALQGDSEAARRYAIEALSLSREAGGYWLRLCLQVWALLGARDGRHAEAARLMGFVDQAFARSGEARQKPEQQLQDLVMAVLRKHLSQDSISVWAREGAKWAEAQAIVCAEALDKVAEML